MWLNIVKVVISAIILVAVSEVSQRMPRLGGLLLSLPLVSILAFLMSWTRYHDLPSISRPARETLILVPLGLPFFCRWLSQNALGWIFGRPSAQGSDSPLPRSGLTFGSCHNV